MQIYVKICYANTCRQNMQIYVENEKKCNSASPVPGYSSSIPASPKQQIRVNSSLLVNTSDESDQPCSGDAGADSHQRPATTQLPTTQLLNSTAPIA